MLVTLEDIRAAAERLEPVLRQTPIEHVHAVSRAAKRDVWVKEEQLQRTGSYKIRGAFNFIDQLAPNERVVAASAGNHAQGVALASAMTGHRCDVFMPKRAALPKIEATEAYGANVVLVDGDLERCVALAKEHSTHESATFVPPFDHPAVIAGQGTVGLELASELPEGVEAVVVPLGGGGLVSGVAVAMKALRPEIKVIGVEAAGAPAMSRSLRQGTPVTLDRVNTMADGIAMRAVSALTLEHVQQLVDQVVLVTEAEMSHALIVLLERAKAVIEPGAAASLAAVMAGEIPGERSVCAVLSGGNVDPVLLMKLIEQGLTSSGRFLVIRIVFNDAPGQLASISQVMADLGVNIASIDRQRIGHHVEANQVHVEMTLEMRNRNQHVVIIESLEAAGYRAETIF